MKNKKIIFSLLTLVVISVFGVFALSFLSNPSAPTENYVQYGSNVCTYVERANGDIEQLGCSSNLVTDAGLDHIKNQLGQGFASTAFDFIGLCNATLLCQGPAAGDTTLESEFVTSGLSRAQGTYSTLGTGNWSVFKTFTATTGGLTTNKTGIFNASTGGTLLAENTFTLVSLENNDQLTVNWTIQVTNP